MLPRQRNEVIAGKYLVQYTFAAIGSASIVPLIDAIGMGLASTIGKCSPPIFAEITICTDLQLRRHLRHNCWPPYLVDSKKWVDDAVVDGR